MKNSPIQLSLPVHLPDDETFNSYYFTANNNELIENLKLSAQGQREDVIYLWGAKKSGRTHLLHAACAYANELDKSSFYLPLAIYQSLSPELLIGLEQLNLICIDDLDTIAGHPVWEEAIFDLYNRVAEQKDCHLIIAATSKVSDANFFLPDLSSRLQWGLNYQLQPLADTDKLAALQQRAAIRGLALPEDVGRFLLNRLARDLRTLFDVLDKLDRYSLVHKRKLTIPFVKDMLRL